MGMHFSNTILGVNWIGKVPYPVSKRGDEEDVAECAAKAWQKKGPDGKSLGTGTLNDHDWGAPGKNYERKL